DTGQRLQVGGDAFIKGSGNTSATFGLTVQNSNAENYLRARNDGRIILGSQTVNFAPFIQPNNGVSTLNIDGTHLYFGNANNDNANTGPAGFWFEASFSAGSGGQSKLLNLTGAFTGATGAEHTNLRLGYTINQVAGATGITRGLYVNPTLTAAADWRSIEWSNNSGWGLYGAGTANNYFNGGLLVGTTTTVSGYKLVVSGSIYASTHIRFDEAIRDNRDNTIISQSLSSVVTNRILTIGNGTYLNINFPNGNLLVGTTTDSGQKLQVVGTTISTATNIPFQSVVTSSEMYNSFFVNTSTLIGYIGNGDGIITNGGTNNFGIRAEADLIFAAGGNNRRMTITSGGNLLVGTTVDSGDRLSVNGTSKFSSDFAISGSTGLLYNAGQLGFTNTASGGQYGIYTLGTSNPIMFFDHRATGNTGSWSWRSGTGGATTAMTLSNAGAATFSSSVTASSFIPTSSTIPTNGMYLPSANTLGFASGTSSRMVITST
ncbi:MAG: hypothetical protein ACOVOV_19995, partial [Dolichospermum sp.]